MKAVKMEKHVGLLFGAFYLFLLFNQSMAIDGNYNVLELGANPDGRTDSTKSFLTAWTAACGSTKPATIYVPKGSYLVKQAQFFGPCKNYAISFSIDGTLVAPSDYTVTGNFDFWLQIHNVEGVSIRGGILDGQGTALWDCKHSGNHCPGGATTLGFTNSSNISISGVTSLNSQLYHLVFNGCNNIELHGINVSAAGNSHNTDGIHVQFSSGVRILNSDISTGDDCVSIGSGTTNLLIENIFCGPGHGISIGSLGKVYEEEGVTNVRVKNVTFTNTQNGVRIKSWGRPSKGFVKEVLFQNATMINVRNPIIIDQNYCPNNKNCPGQVSGVKISDVTYQDIHGTSATEVAVKFDCSEKNPCSGIVLQDVKLTYKSEPAKSQCANAVGTKLGLTERTICL